MNANDLASLYPTLTVRNRRNVSTNISYANGDSVTLQPLVQKTISTVGLHQLPDHNDVELIKPTIFDLIEDGIVEMPSTPTE